MKIILELSQLFLLVDHLLLMSLHGERINAGLSMLGLVLLEPIVLCLDLLLAFGTPTRDPVIGDGVENETRALLSRRQALFVAEFLPLSLVLLLRSGLLSRREDLGLGKLHTP